MKKGLFVWVGLVFLWTGPVHAEWKGRVVSVYDGDTLVVSNDGRGEIVRLAGVDAPEREQAFGLTAKGFAADLVRGKTVRVVPYGDVDNYKVYVDELCLNEELLRAGYAWYDARSGVDAGYAALEETARSAGRGLWADADPIPPWRFKREGKEEESASPVSIKLPGVHGSAGSEPGGGEGAEQPVRKQSAPPRPPKAPPPSK
jgi:endonuclease YncB( thermonuclease family)